MVTELKGKYSFDVEVIRKTDIGLLKRISLPSFPALEIDGEIVFQGQDITLEELERELSRRTSSS